MKDFGHFGFFKRKTADSLQSDTDSNCDSGNSPPAKKSRQSKVGRHRETGFSRAWLEQFPWLLYDDEKGILLNLLSYSRTPANGHASKTARAGNTANFHGPELNPFIMLIIYVE